VQPIGTTCSQRQLSSFRQSGIAILLTIAWAASGLAQSTGIAAQTGAAGETGQAPTFKILYTFKGGADGLTPEGTLVRDAAGNLYGTFTFGGDLECSKGFTLGCGAAFRLDKTGKKTNLYAFDGGTADGEVPEAGLVRDSAGNLYGTTMFGGNGPCFGKGRVEHEPALSQSPHTLSASG